jgi:hypothetical protein
MKALARARGNHSSRLASRPANASALLKNLAQKVARAALSPPKSVSLARIAASDSHLGADASTSAGTLKGAFAA